jgi:predicted nuclease of restriction endonuclease-like RecB superfamily
MLTLDLLRTRIRGDCIEPRYVDTGSGRHRKLAAALIEIYAAHGDCRRGELDEALSRHSGDRVDYRIQRGLAKLLFDDHCDFGVVAALPPEQLRERVFAVAHSYHPVVREPDLFHVADRGLVIAEAGESCGLSGEQVEEGLYADLAQNHRLVSFQPPSPQQLLNRYNVALAQAMLYRCREIEVTIDPDHRARHRQLFSAIKFNRLIHTVTRERGGKGFRVVLDGPVSMFRHSQRYGVRMAVFLPALLQCRRWQLTAVIPEKSTAARGRSPRGEKETVAKAAVIARRFELDERTGLVSHYPERPQYDSSVEEVFARRFERLKSDWALERESEFIDFKDAVMIPDFTFRHADGSTALLEIVGYWRPEYLSRKLAKLQQAKRSDMIVAVSQVLNVSRDELGKLPGEVVFFKNRLDPAGVLERLEQMRSAGSLNPGISS